MAKKSHTQHPQKKQVSSMPHPRPHIVNAAAASLQHQSPLQDNDEDDLDDICPVCESECTCPKKSAPPTLATPSASSILSSAPSNDHLSSAGKRPLTIKLTLPPKLKAKKPPAPHLVATGAHPGTADQHAGPSSSRPPVAAVPKRRGRPRKGAAVKCNAKKKPTADDMEYRARGTTGTSAIMRTVYQSPVPVASTSAADLSDSTLSDYPTFVPAASESTHTSSSESSDSSIESSDDEDDRFIVRNDDTRHSTKLLPSHVGHKKRERGGNGRWEIRSRKKSVGAREEEEEESDSDDSSEDASEDGDDEDEDEDDDTEEDVQPNGASVVDGGMVLDEEEETHSRIGVSFPGTGWSDEDEESSFDADIFFANLDSDSGASSPEVHHANLFAFPSEDAELVGSFSAEEEDALLLMDLDPSVRLRRGNGEFEIGVDLDRHSFGWDRQLLLRGGEGPGLSFGIQPPDEDEEMESVSGSEATASWEGSAAGTIVLQEDDGDTTEDELVDSDGLPNPRAMMLFRWPTTISAINPLSTLSPVSDPPANASPSTRIALASISAQRRSPPPTPSPADILAGRVSLDDLEDIEMDQMEMEKNTVSVRRRRGSGVPIMGEFVVGPGDECARRTAVVRVGSEAHSFYPRAMRVPMSGQHDDAPSESTHMASMRPPLVTESSEENLDLSQQSYTSDLSSSEAIELDDVLDSSLLDSEPSMQEQYDTDFPDSQSQSSPIKLGPSPHLQNLSRWDRIPMATFRRTRESATASGVDGAVSDSGLGALQYRGIGALMGGMSLFTPPRSLGLDKMSRASARKKKGRQSHGSSPMLLPARDGVLGPSLTAPANPGGYMNKSKKELKKEKAMMKRKLVAKASQHKYHQPQRGHHHHHPNHKSRATNAVQRPGFSSGPSSAIPSLTI